MQYKSDASALAALTAGKIVAYFTDSPLAGADVLAQPDAFEILAGLPSTTPAKGSPSPATGTTCSAQSESRCSR